MPDKHGLSAGTWNDPGSAAHHSAEFIIGRRFAPTRWLRAAPRPGRVASPTHSLPAYSAFAPDALTTVAHFCVSAASMAPKAAGLSGIGSLPTSASRARMVGSASPALIT